MRKLFKANELFLIIPIILTAAALYLFYAFSPKGSVAVIEINGRVYEEISLYSLTGPQTIEVPGDMTVTVRLERDFAEIIESPCPDKLCVRQGKITKAGQSAVCLPAKVSVRLKGSGGTDGVTY